MIDLQKIDHERFPMSNNVASIISTGGGGGDFERRVGAYFLGLLLTNSFSPIFSDSAPTRVHFQAKRLGWNIDDLVVELRSQTGDKHNLCAQVKRTFVVSEADDECVATVAAAWRDFNNAALFRQGSDAIVLVTYLGTNRIQHDLRWLFGQAKASASPADFLARLNGAGALNKRSKADYKVIESIVLNTEGCAVADERI